ncbi:hypothetical protein ACJDT4_09425 [Clostridium neuense]|uniref:Phage protein n=1 Tax=Clostridium neuense TaxID=1728934 RepID=A0ABW8TDQ3_9CLOT
MKIILSNKCRQHMEAHKNDFVVDWKELIELCEVEGKFNHLHKSFEIIKVEFPFSVGYCNCIETDANDEIVFAKRYGRDTYSRFILNKSSNL